MNLDKILRIPAYNTWFLPTGLAKNTTKNKADLKLI